MGKPLDSKAVAAAIESVKEVSGGRVLAVVIPDGVPTEEVMAIRRAVDLMLEEARNRRDARRRSRN